MSVSDPSASPMELPTGGADRRCRPAVPTGGAADGVSEGGEGRGAELKGASKQTHA